MLASLLWMQSYGAYVVFLQQEFGWSKTIVAGAFALTRIESGILGPLQGWLVDRYGPRVILRIGVVLFGLGFIGFSRVETLLEFYLCFAVIALGSSLGGFATVMVSIVSWFNRHRAKAVAFSQIGYALGGMCVPLVVLALEAFGWRVTAFYSGVLVILLGLPMSQAVRHRPETYGDVPDGRMLPNHNSSEPMRADMTAQQAMKTPAFWLISFGHAAALLTVSAVMVHLVPHLTEGLNFSLGHAALMVTLVTACQLVGQLLGGVLGDRFDKRLICVLCMIAHTGALLLLAFASSQVDVVMFAVLHGLAWGIRGPLMVALRADYFGAASFGTIMGFSSLIVMLGMSFGPLVAGLFADYYGNYQLGLTVLALTAFLGCFCFMGARRPA
ncbi:MAG: MFS transporter [Pseudomonadales bacterium]